MGNDDGYLFGRGYRRRSFILFCLVYAQTDGVIFWFLCWYIIFHFFFLCDGIVKFLDAQRLLFQVIFGWRYLNTIDVFSSRKFQIRGEALIKIYY